MKRTKDLKFNKRYASLHDCNQNGITLIALIITIIIMLILVAVTITTTINGGLFGYAQKGVSETQIEQEKEYITFAVATIKMKKYSENDNTIITADELETELKKYKNVSVEGSNNLLITFESGREYTINQAGDIMLGDSSTQITRRWQQFAISDSSEVITLDLSNDLNRIYGLDVDGNVYKYMSTDTDDNTTDIGMTEIITGKNIVQISAGRNDAAGIDKDGKVWIWGESTEEEIVCLSSQSDSPIKNVEMVQLSIGESGLYGFLDNNGKVWLWKFGLNMVCISDATESPLDGINIIQISIGDENVVALDSRGKVWTWGIGGIGDGSSTKIDIPICISEIEENPLNGIQITQISAGKEYVVALDSNGKVWTWGYNPVGNLGNGTYEDSALPVCINDIEENALNGIKVVKVEAGAAHTVVLDNNGHVWSWGYNGTGQLADGTTEHTDVPICVSDINSILNEKKIIEIEAGGLFTVLLDNNDEMYIYGEILDR